MHEIAIAKKVVDDVEKKVKGATVKSVYLILGELAPVTPEELRQGIAKFRGWTVNIKTEDAVVSCTCDYKGRPNIVERAHDIVVWECPVCKQYYPEVISGDSIKIEKVVTE
ncbi:hydrogenase maturation nickel metallochaperone HypA [Candidatus Micrarchaeota archaeon]|nr:hydrogenase maturation nickel metallochaperone HypA [Candidatus Micrarchaeota archaeon]